MNLESHDRNGRRIGNRPLSRTRPDSRNSQMTHRLHLFVAFVLAHFIALTTLEAQLVKNSFRTVDSDSTTPKFSFSTSVGLSLAGPVYKSEFKMIDELGLEYDVMSLLSNKSIREEIVLSEVQYASMTKIKNKLNSNLAELIQSMTSEKMKVVKSQIIETEAALNSMLKPVQSQRLEQLKNQMGINRFGLASYLNSTSMVMAMGMSNEEARQFKSNTDMLKNELKEKLNAIQRDSNSELLTQFSNRQRSMIQKVFGDIKYEQFLISKLFSDNKPRLRKLDKNQVAMLNVLQSPKLRRELDIVDDQYGEIRKSKSDYDQRLSEASQRLLGSFHEDNSVTARAKELKQLSDRSHEEFQEELRRILLDFQLKRLDQIVAELETTRMGTVGVLCHGCLSKMLPVKKNEIQKLFDFGMKLEQERQKRAARLLETFQQQVLALLSPIQEKRMASLLGETASFELR